MSIEQKRAKLKSAYPGDRWQIKVNKMPDAQVHAAYMRLMNQNQFKSYSK